MPVAGRAGTTTITLAVNDGTLTTTESFTLTVTPLNAPPAISDVGNRTINRNTSTGPIAFTVSDGQTAAAALTMTGSSSNPTLVPQANIVFGGTGANRTVTVTPTANQTGAATITLTVIDGTLTASDGFLLTVTSQPLFLTYNFDTNGFQGWTMISTDRSNRQFFAIQPPAANSPNTTSQGGAGFVGLHIPAFGGSPFYYQDSEQGTLWLRSPAFTLDGAGDLICWLTGGGSSSPSLSGQSVGSVPLSSVNNGFRGVALRNALNNTFALSGKRSSDGNVWQQITFTATQLAALDQNAAYTLDFIDAGDGGWGWVHLDSVSIPGLPLPTQPPPLTIQKWTANQLRIAWPASATGYTLQKSATLPGGWGNAGLAVTTEGGESVSYTPASASAQFYRLMK